MTRAGDVDVTPLGDGRFEIKVVSPDEAYRRNWDRIFGVTEDGCGCVMPGCKGRRYLFSTFSDGVVYKCKECDYEWSETNEPELGEWIAESWDDLCVIVDGQEAVIFAGTLDDEYGNFWSKKDQTWHNYAY